MLRSSSKNDTADLYNIQQGRYTNRQNNLLTLMNKCKLCHQEKELQHSHIVPEFLYKKLYNGNHKMLGITGIGNKGFKKEQKGLREYLLCRDCEALINQKYEVPFRVYWVDNNALPLHWPNHKEIKQLQADYKVFKLFHLSVLFRASVSTLPTFEEVSLGPHEEVIRKMLLSNDPGPSEKYPIYGYAVINDKNDEVVDVVSKAIASRDNNGHRAYGIIYGGVHWWFGVSEGALKEIRGATINEDGKFVVNCRKMSEVSLFQEASEALNVNKKGFN